MRSYALIDSVPPINELKCHEASIPERERERERDKK